MKYTVLAARIIYDRFEVEAPTPKEAAYLVANGKIPETECHVMHKVQNQDEHTIQVLENGTEVGVFDSSIILFQKE